MDEYLESLTCKQLSFANGESLGLLMNKQYSIQDLEHIVKFTSTRLKTILKTQFLDYRFCKTFLLSDNYTRFDCDEIYIDDIAYYQPHTVKHFNDLELLMINFK